MAEFKLYGVCQSCKKKRFFIRKRDIHIPVAKIPAKSLLLLCNGCFRKVLKVVYAKHLKNGTD